MRLVFMGTPRFAVPPLQALAKAGHDIAGVVTRIDKPAGRGRTMAQPAVKVAALEIGLTVYQPKHVRDPDVIESLRRLTPEVIIVAAYGQILPKEILALPKYGCINIHASLLPLYRGAAPINWAIIHGETRTGNTIMLMEEGLDTGAILLQEAIPIDPTDTAGTLTEKLSALGAKLITAALPLIEARKLTPEPQDNSRATLAPLLKKEDGLINWKLSALEIHHQVRGLTPWPGAYTFLDETMVKILETETLQGRGEPGRIHEGMRGSLDVGTGSGLLRIIRVQQAGKKPMDAANFLRGHRGIEGKEFTTEQRTHGTKV
jgi:methionyl-tRNA formyltransferase